MDLETFKAARKVILANAASLLRAAEKLGDSDVDHVRYHLAALALEEVGKVSLLGMQFVTGITKDEPVTTIAKQYDDHVKKLFWALWGPSFVRTKLTREQLEEHQGLARRIHEKRLFSLYSDPEVNLLPSEKVSREEVDNLVGLAEVRLRMEESQEIVSIDNSEDLRWFLSASNDPEIRSQLFGTKSLEKLTELGDVRQWVAWVRNVLREHDAQMRELIQKEMARQPPSDRTGNTPKWRIKFRIYSHSHSIRQKALKAWNDHTQFIT